MKFFKTILLFIISFAAYGCFEQLESPGTQASIAKYITPNDFSGANTAVNIITGIQINWAPVNASKNFIGYKVYRYSLGTKKLIASLSTAETSYIDGDVISGSKYQYIVKAVDPSYDEDGNNNIVSAIYWSGLTSVTSTSNDSVTVNFDGTLQGYHLRISIQETNSAVQEVVKTLTTPSELSNNFYKIISWTNNGNNKSIKPGSRYTIYAQILDPATGIGDGNLVGYDVTTQSYGFDNQLSTNAPGWNNIANVRAFGRSPGTQHNAYTAAPTMIAPMSTSIAHVELSFLPFTLPNGFSQDFYRYTVIRFGEFVIPDTDINLQPCANIGTAITLTETDLTNMARPCIIADDLDPRDISQGGDLSDGLFQVVDNNVWESTTSLPYSNDKKPPRYRYTMVLKHLDAANSATGYRERLPVDKVNQFSVLVAIPPNNMVLVNRESINYEFCTVQKNSKSIPTEFNRCANGEVGSKPVNSSPGNPDLNLQSGYYDFGYNLFVDRYPLACNNNVTDSGNFGGTAVGDYITSSIYNANTGTLAAALTSVTNAGAPTVSGSVAFHINTRPTINVTSCSYYSNNGQWLRPDQIISNLGIIAGSIAFERMFTNDPSKSSAVQNADNSQWGKAKVTFPHWDSTTANVACGSFKETGYGLKRIPRMREYRAYTAPPINTLVGSSYVRDLHAQDIYNATRATSANWSSGQCVLGDFNTRISNIANNPANINAIQNANTGVFGNTNFTGSRIVARAGTTITTSFLIGASHTAGCISRYGVADILDTPSHNTSTVMTNGVSSSWVPISDMFIWNPNDGANGTLKGVTSTIDSGNSDVNNHYSSQEPTGFEIPLPATGGGFFSTSNAEKFDIALGIPVIHESEIAAYGFNRTRSQNYDVSNMMFYPSGGTALFNTYANARYSTSFGSNSGARATYATQVRCVLPAD